MENNDAPLQVDLTPNKVEATGLYGRKLFFVFLALVFGVFGIAKWAIGKFNHQSEERHIQQTAKAISDRPAISIANAAFGDKGKPSPTGAATVEVPEKPPTGDTVDQVAPPAPPSSDAKIPTVNITGQGQFNPSGGVYTVPVQVSGSDYGQTEDDKAEMEFELRSRGTAFNPQKANPGPQAVAQNRPVSFPGPSAPDASRAGYAPPVGISAIDDAPRQADREKDNQKAFLKDSGARASDYLETNREMPRSLFEVQSGTFIPIILDGNNESTLPGEITAHVRGNVYDSKSGRYIMIPKGSKLLGEYNASIAYGQNGLQTVWTRLIFPDTSFIDLGRMSGYAPDGSNGFRDKTNSHWKKVFATALISSVMTAGFQISQSRGNQSQYGYPSPGQAAAAAVGMEGNRVADQLVSRAASQQPTILIRAGYPGLVRINKDIVFDGPYEDRVK